VIHTSLILQPEWAPQSAIWTAWPAAPEQWNDDLESPRRDVAALIEALAPTNKVMLLVNGAEAEASARAAVGSAAVLVSVRYGDIWLRDTGPIFAQDGPGAVALRFATNSWGGKYDLPDDATVGDEIAKAADMPVRRFPFVLEGGAIDHDGAGTILTTRLLDAAQHGGWVDTDGTLQRWDRLRPTMRRRIQSPARWRQWRQWR